MHHEHIAKNWLLHNIYQGQFDKVCMVDTQMNIQKLPNTLNLSQQPPRPPQALLGGYAILGRTVDKCRADIAGQVGEYHFDCPVDNMLFTFKRITGEQFKEAVASGKTDDEMVAWINSVGEQRSQHDIEAWSKSVINSSPYDNLHKRDWFVGVCTPLGIDPSKVTLFDFLNVDDTATFRHK